MLMCVVFRFRFWYHVQLLEQFDCSARLSVYVVLYLSYIEQINDDKQLCSNSRCAASLLNSSLLVEAVSK